MTSGFGTARSRVIHNIFLQVSYTEGQVNTIECSYSTVVIITISIIIIIIIIVIIIIIIASSDHVARLWHVEQTQPIREYHGHSKAVTALAYCDK